MFSVLVHVTPQANKTHPLLIFVAMLTLSIRVRLEGLLVRFRTGFSWPPNQTFWMSWSMGQVYWLVPSGTPVHLHSVTASKKVCELRALKSLDLTYLSHWLACKSYLFRARAQLFLNEKGKHALKLHLWLNRVALDNTTTSTSTWQKLRKLV